MKSRKELLNEVPTGRVLVPKVTHNAPPKPKAGGPAAILKPVNAGPDYPERKFMIGDRVEIRKPDSCYNCKSGWIKGFRFNRHEPEYSVKLDGVDKQVIFPQSQLKEGDLLIAHGGLIAKP